MAGNSIKKGKAGTATLTFTVAECGEFHSLGEYHEGIKTLDEAVSIYRNIPPGRIYGKKRGWDGRLQGGEWLLLQRSPFLCGNGA